MLYSLIEDHCDFVVVNKYPGIVVQGAPDGRTLLNAVRSDLKLNELYPVHRLDRDTSGLVVFAKTRMANQALSRAFADKLVSKVYLAISDAKPSKKQGLIRGDILKGRNGSYKLSRTLENPAQTRFNSCSLKPGFRLFALEPLTGKTHQLRVALKSLSAPILGDKRYGGSDADRMYLHAYILDFTLNDQRYHFKALPASGRFFDRELLEYALRDRLQVGF